MSDEEIPTILVVDDDEELSTIIEDFLTDFKIIKAKDGKEAVELYKQYTPEIVLMDIVMPNMNGIDATKEIKKINPDATILAMTGHASEKGNEALNAGVDTVISKPIQLPNLLAEIETYIQRISYNMIQNRLNKVEQQLLELKKAINRIEQHQIKISKLVEKSINKLFKGIISLYNITLFVIMLLQRLTSSENFKEFLQQNRNLIVMTGVGVGLIFIMFILPQTKKLFEPKKKPRFVLGRTKEVR